MYHKLTILRYPNIHKSDNTQNFINGFECRWLSFCGHLRREFQLPGCLVYILVVPVDHQGETLDLASIDSGFPLQRQVSSCGFRLLCSVQMT